MNIYEDPAQGAPQLVWDLHDAVTMLDQAALLIAGGHDKAAADALALAIHSTKEALEKVNSAEYMAKAFPEMKVAA